MTATKKKKKWTRRDWFDLILVLICIPILAIGFAVSLSVYQTKQQGGVTTIMGRCFLTVQTGSMEPELMVGETFICKTIPASEVKVGDTISFFEGKKIITHKVHSIGTREVDGKEEIYFVTYGINNKRASGEYKLDDFKPGEGQLIGIYSGKSTFNKFAGFLTSKWGLFCFVIIPLGVLIITDILSLISYIGPKQKKEENEEESGDEDDKNKDEPKEPEPKLKTEDTQTQNTQTPQAKKQTQTTQAPQAKKQTQNTQTKPQAKKQTQNTQAKPQAKKQTQNTQAKPQAKAQTQNTQTKPKKNKNQSGKKKSKTIVLQPKKNQSKY